jgi:Spy/CpxP family protein refolding chaperone
MIRILLFAILCLPLAAQPPRGNFAWWDSPIARDLNLTDEQQKEIRSVVAQYRTKLIDLRGTVEKAEGELEDLLNEERVDQNRGNEVINRLATSRAELGKAFAQMSLRLRTVLTAQQWHELQKRRPAMMPGGGPMGPPNGAGRGQHRRPGGQPPE